MHPTQARKCRTSFSPPLQAVTNVPQEKLRNSIQLKTLKCHAEAFCRMANESPNYRLAGSTGYNATASYVVEQLESFGDYYNIERQPFSSYVEYFNEGEVTIDGEEAVSATMQFSRNATLENRKLIWVNSFGCNGVSVAKRPRVVPY
jgi:carboxypeptidase Q